MRSLGHWAVCILLLATSWSHAAIRSDRQIWENVRAVLATELEDGIEKIDIVVEDGVVSLHGTVRSKAEQSEALSVADQVQGVQRVIDRLLATVDEEPAARTPDRKADVFNAGADAVTNQVRIGTEYAYQNTPFYNAPQSLQGERHNNLTAPFWWVGVDPLGGNAS